MPFACSLGSTSVFSSRASSLYVDWQFHWYYQLMGGGKGSFAMRQESGNETGLK